MSQIAEKNETYSQEVGTLSLDIPTGEFLWNFLIYPKNDIILDSTLIIRIIYIYSYPRYYLAPKYATFPRIAHALANARTQTFLRFLKIPGGIRVGAYSLRFISRL